jgi:hypothetical protein
LEGSVVETGVMCKIMDVGNDVRNLLFQDKKGLIGRRIFLTQLLDHLINVLFGCFHPSSDLS